MKYTLQADLEKKRKDKHRFVLPLKDEEIPLYVHADSNKIEETEQDEEPEKILSMLSCLARQSKQLYSEDDDVSFENLKNELFQFSKASTALEYENKVEQQGYLPNFPVIEDVARYQILAQQPSLNHLFYSFDSSAYKFLDILLEELLKYHTLNAAKEQNNKKTTLETKKNELNEKLPSLPLQTKSSNEGQMKLEEYAESINQRLLQRQHRRAEFLAEEKVRQEKLQKQEKTKQRSKEVKHPKKKRKTK